MGDAPTKDLLVAVTRKLPDPVEERLSSLFKTSFTGATSPLPRDELLSLARTHDVLAATLGDVLDASFFADAGDRMKLVANFGAGIDHIDVVAANKHGVTVTNTPSVLAEDAADMAMALMLAVPRRIVEGVRALEAGQFSGWSPNWMLGHRLRGRRLGIVGLGRVGQAIANRARGFGLSIHYHNRQPINPHIEEALQATYWENLDEMLPNIDILSISCPATEQTHHLINANRLSILPKQAFVVNVSRGEIIDEGALADAIDQGTLAGAGLDVFEHEPTPNKSLLASPKVVLTPHMASSTVETRIEMGARVIINIKMFADGHKPPDRIIPGLS
ncbi:MAG: D-glycerate dehydrogenase [Pseudomonadota bacterium]